VNAPLIVCGSSRPDLNRIAADERVHPFCSVERSSVTLPVSTKSAYDGPEPRTGWRGPGTPERNTGGRSTRAADAVAERGGKLGIFSYGKSASARRPVEIPRC